ncbi:MAG: C10 family peptidase [Bacteroidaceae bacterium]|nr:C10 family peptidase [Bacteroidaceae bacterium]
MKKVIYILLATPLLFFMSACENDDEQFEVLEQPTQQENPYYVPFETALANVENLFAQEDLSTRTRHIERTVESHQEYVANRGTRSASDSIEVKFHVINFENNQGFALVSADSRTTSIYAYSTTGHLDMEYAIANTGFGDFMEDATEFYKEEIVNGKVIPGDPEPIDTTHVKYKDIPLLPLVEIDGGYYHIREGDKEVRYTTGELLSVAWEQWFPYNYFCEENLYVDAVYHGKAAAGCGPIAAAQIMSYYRYPYSAVGTTFDWSLIMTSPSYYKLTTASMETAHLIKTIGETAHATYGVSTTVTTTNIGSMFKKFGYSISGPADFDYSKIQSSLNAFHPVYTRGNSGDVGHAWVIDGYTSYQHNVTYYYTYPPYDVYKTSTIYDEVYYHCNWGEGTYTNSWCLSPFKTYNDSKQIIYNIQPQ